MIHKIVTLMDGSSLARRVLPHTRALAETFQASVTLLRVLEPRPKEKKDTGRLDPINWHLKKIAAQSSLDNISNKISAGGAVGKIETETILLEGTAADRIVEYIDETKPDLIMLSSHGGGGLSPWNVGSVAQKIIDRAFHSIMLVRAYDENDPGDELDSSVRYQRILVPLDGSKRAENVLPFANSLAADHEAELWLIHAQVPPAIIQGYSLTDEETAALDQLNECSTARAQKYLSQIAEQLKPEVQLHHLTGANTADLLLEFVDTHPIDLVVMSAHGHSSETIRPYGSIVSGFIAYGSTPLLIIQDLSQDQIKPTKAEQSAINDIGDTGRRNRTNAYAQPANWSTEK